MGGGRVASILVGLLVTGCGAHAATDPSDEALPEPTSSSWEFSISAYTSFVPDGSDYVQPTFTADHGKLHLEGRHNYEALDTGSVWVGYNFSVGESVQLEIMPMPWAVFGDTNRIAPGYRGTLDWRWLDF